ncbi:ribosome-associated translation inhibitor RaiA [Candidatus Parcubacteria bacterium]|jgi:putative sigma-54 modulation protein|nr:ribosome-associated translation inhibitor RaiA [Candidatus Parcubacteria bacterium]
MDIQIYNRNFDLTDSFREYLEDKFNSLDKYQEKIMSFNVNLSRNQKHNKGEIFTVEARVTLPQKQTIAIKETHSDPRAAVDAVQDKLSRQLVKYKDKNLSRWRKSARKIKSLKFWRRNQE